MRIYSVFVDAARTEVAAQKLNAIAQAVRNRQETGGCAQGCRVVFFDWNSIGLLQVRTDRVVTMMSTIGASGRKCSRLMHDWSLSWLRGILLRHQIAFWSWIMVSNIVLVAWLQQSGILTPDEPCARNESA
jgi:hypothetical protein